MCVNLEKSACGSSRTGSPAEASASGACFVVEALAPSRSVSAKTMHAEAMAASESRRRTSDARVETFDGGEPFGGCCSSGSWMKFIAVHFFGAGSADACDAGTGRRPLMTWHLTHSNLGFAILCAISALSMPSGVASV